MKTRNSQQGMALLILVFIITLAITSYILHSLSSASIEKERDTKTFAALSEAKTALLGWSVRQNSPGQLPCPEDITLIGLPTEGQAQSNCTSPNPVIGRLPWRTLGLGDIRDGNDEKLWYVISTGFRTSPINSNSLGQLTVDGVPNSAVAIIFSAGVPLAGQSRPATNAAPAAITQYLESSNNDGDNTFVNSGPVGSFNDRLMPVSHAELFSIVTNRVLGEIKGDGNGLNGYYASESKYPYADALPLADGFSDDTVLIGTPSYQAGLLSLDFTKMITDDSGASISVRDALINNNWFQLINYAVTSNQQQVTLILNGKTILVKP